MELLPGLTCGECVWFNIGMCNLGLGKGRTSSVNGREECLDRALCLRATHRFIATGSESSTLDWASAQVPAKRKRATKPNEQARLLEVTI